MPSVVKKVVKGTENRVSGVVSSVFDTIGKTLKNAKDATVGVVHVAKNVVTLDGKNLKKDLGTVGKSTKNFVKDAVKGTVKTAKVAVVGQEKKKKSTKKTVKK